MKKYLLALLLSFLFVSPSFAQGTTAENIVLGTITTGSSCPTYPCWQPISTANPLNISTTGSSTLSLTTSGSSGAATLVGSVLNIPVYSSGAGTVTQFNFTNANGASGSVATSTTTPTLTLTPTAGGSFASSLNNLGFFSATSSAQLAGVMSDETGTGALVFAGSPTFTGTVLGAVATWSGTNTALAMTTTTLTVAGNSSLAGTTTVAAFTATGNTALNGTTTFLSANPVSIVSTGNVALNLTATTSTAVLVNFSGVNGNTSAIDVTSQTGPGDQLVFNFNNPTTGIINWLVYRFGGAGNKWFFGDNGTDAFFQTNHDMKFTTAVSNPSTSATPALTLATNLNATFGAQVNVPNMTASSAAQTGTVCWGASGVLTVDTTVGCLTSTKANKENIVAFSGGLSEVMKFKPVSFYYKDKKLDSSQELGLLAEDVVQVEPRLVGYGSDGKLRGVRYEQLTAVLISAIQDQQKEIEDLKKKVSLRSGK